MFMSDTNTTCPQCGKPIKVEDTHCKSCGVNIAVAISMLELKIISVSTRPVIFGEPYETDIHLTRLGEFLVKNGDITESQLQAALERQKSASARSWRRSLGQVLLEMGAVSREQLDLAALQQMRELRERLNESITKRDQKVERPSKKLSGIRHTLSELQSSLRHVKAANSALAKAKLNEKQRKSLLASKEAVREIEKNLKGLGKTEKKNKK
jgi:archaellum component FlaC